MVAGRRETGGGKANGQATPVSRARVRSVAVARHEAEVAGAAVAAPSRVRYSARYGRTGCQRGTDKRRVPARRRRTQNKRVAVHRRNGKKDGWDRTLGGCQDEMDETENQRPPQPDCWRAGADNGMGHKRKTTAQPLKRGKGGGQGRKSVETVAVHARQPGALLAMGDGRNGGRGGMERREADRWCRGTGYSASLYQFWL